VFANEERAKGRKVGRKRRRGNETTNVECANVFNNDAEDGGKRAEYRQAIELCATAE
jgi:hypothetical protein